MRVRMSRIIPRWLAVTLLMVVAVDSAVAADDTSTLCSSVVATFPAADAAPGKSLGSRFQIRRCLGSYTVQVVALEGESSTPSVFVDTHEPWPKLLVHARNVLVLQTVGGSSSAVYVLSFRKGKAQPLLSRDTRGIVKVSIDEERDRVIIDVPPDPRVTVTVPGKRFEIEYE
jgi:hypothetical protein